MSEEDRRPVSAVYVLRPKADQDLDDQRSTSQLRQAPTLVTASF